MDDSAKQKVDWSKVENVSKDPVYNAYKILVDTLHNKKSTKQDFGNAMEEAIGYLGEVLE